MLGDFLANQFIEVIQWLEPGDGLLACRYPMRDQEIKNGGQLTVRESQVAAFINEGRIADVFGPGLHTLSTHNLPLLTDLMNWDKGFQSPFKCDVYFFFTRLQIDQKWGTSTPITVRDPEFGAARLRAFGNYAYRVSDPRKFFTEVCGTRETFHVAELEGQLRTMIVARMTEVFANSNVSFLDMAATQATLSAKIAEQAKPSFTALGLELEQFVVESVSLPEELQKVLDQRIGMQIAGDLHRLTQYEAAQSLEDAALNAGGTAGMGVGLGAGAAMAQALMGQVQNSAVIPPQQPQVPVLTGSAHYCTECGKPVGSDAKFCGSCGKAL